MQSLAHSWSEWTRPRGYTEWMATSSAPLPFLDPDGEFVDALLGGVKPTEKGDSDEHFYELLASSRPVVAAFVESLFWASTAHEEGRPVGGCVVLSDWNRPDVSRFAEHKFLDARRLVQLLTALPFAVLGVSIVDGKPVAWGYRHRLPAKEQV